MEGDQITTEQQRIEALVVGYADEFTEKAELVRTLGKQLISLALQGESVHPVEWIVRIGGGDEHALVVIELALRGNQFSIGVVDTDTHTFPTRFTSDADRETDVHFDPRCAPVVSAIRAHLFERIIEI